MSLLRHDRSPAATPALDAAKLGYQPSLDGVRALAVGVVMGTHTDLPGFKRGGGFGVDVFFVLSGFLITTLLLEERAETGRISLGSFYVRRALRLFPALLAVLAAVAFYAYAFADPQLRDDLLAEAAYAITYTTNFGWLHGLNDAWLGHTWSLALEEQFYLLWPPTLLVIVSRLGRRTLGPLLTVAVVACFVARLAGAVGPYYVLTQRPDALLVGSVGRGCPAPDPSQRRGQRGCRPHVDVGWLGGICGACIRCVSGAAPVPNGERGRVDPCGGGCCGAPDVGGTGSQ